MESTLGAKNKYLGRRHRVRGVAEPAVNRHWGAQLLQLGGTTINYRNKVATQNISHAVMVGCRKTVTTNRTRNHALTNNDWVFCCTAKQGFERERNFVLGRLFRSGRRSEGSFLWAKCSSVATYLD